MPLAERKNIEIQNRDLCLLRGLFDARLMTLAHAADIFFDSRKEAAKKRVQKLKSAGLLGERKRDVYEPSILFLTKSGYELLKVRDVLHDAPRIGWPALERRLRVSALTVRHELEVLDVKAAIHTAIRSCPTFAITEFSTWPVLFEFEGSPGPTPQTLVKPDGFIRIQEQDGENLFEHTFFLELDRSTETLDTLARRALCYLDYYQRGGLAERFGRPRSEFQDFPFRVLMVFKTAERRNNIAEKLLTQSPPILTQVWLSTLEEVKADAIGRVWIRPRDYRAVVDGTNYAMGRTTIPAIYRRQTERDTFVESAVEKQSLFDVPSPSSGK